jgi:Fe2+ or Zn2+ uptake regulation protein
MLCSEDEEAQTVYDQGPAHDQDVRESQMLDLPLVPSHNPSTARSRPISALTRQLQAEQRNVSSSPISSPSSDRVVKHTNQALAQRVLSLLQAPEYAGTGLLRQDIADKASTPLASVYPVVDYLLDLELVESLGDERIRTTAAPQVNTQPPNETSPSPLERPIFICTECKREFPSSKELLRHDAKHPRPWKCTFQGCQYQDVGFTTEIARDRHMKQIHNMRESSPWKCTFQGCQYQDVGFTSETARDRHMEQIHNMRESSP